MRRRPTLVVPAQALAPDARVRAVTAGGRSHALTALGGAVDGELRWVQPALLRRVWQLVSDRGEHLLLHGQGLTGRRGGVETPAATWSLSRSWTGEVALTDTEDRPLMRISRGWFGRSRLEPAAGPSLVWRRHWDGSHTLESEEGHELLRLKPRWTFMRWQAVVTLADAARAREDLLELLAVTFFAWLSKPRGHAH